MTAGRKVHLSGRRAFSPAARKALRELLLEVLDHHGLEGDLSVVFVGDDEIRRMHREHFGADTVTDVITFPLDAGDGVSGVPVGPERPLIGEVLVSVDTARREAERRSIPLEREIALYALHGVLHLMGYDDVEPDDRRAMRAAESRWLERFSP